jgi:MFS family permease
VGALWSIRVEPRRPLVVVALTGLVFAIPLALLAVPAPVALLSAGALITGLAMMLGNTVWESTLQRKIPGESLGRVSAYDWFGSLAFQPLGLIVWGPVSGAIGLAATLWIAAGAIAVLAVIVLTLPGTWTLTNERSGQARRGRRATAAK